MRTIRWGIVGCGAVTEVKSGPGFQKARGSELVAVMRRDGAQAADYARRHGVARWYDDAAKLIGDPAVDAVYVATPPGSHEALAMQVLAAGKACYVEKPMARNAAEARRMVEAFAAKGVPLFVAYYRRALPRFLKVKEIIESGVLGELEAIEYRYSDGQMKQRVEGDVPWRLRAEESGGGLFLDLGSHALDLLDFFFGPLERAEGQAANLCGQYDVEDDVVVSFHTPASAGRNGGKMGVGWWRFCADEAVDAFEIAGERATVRFSCFGNEAVRLDHMDGRREIFDMPNPPHVAQPLIQTVVDDLLGVGTCASTGASGLRTQAVMDAALAGFYGGREDGFWQRGRNDNGHAGA